MNVADRATDMGMNALTVTGYAFAYPELSRYALLLKPIRPDELLTEIERALGSGLQPRC